MIARLAFRYLLVFAIVLLALSVGAYSFMAREYQSLLQPALGTPEATQVYNAQMTRVALRIAVFDIPLLLIVGVASWLLARASLKPLIESRERERRFAADAAHRLRSPLATIAAVAQAAKPEAPPQLQEDLQTITAAALDASESVGELLTLTRPADAAMLQCEPVDVGALAGAVSREFAPRAAQRGLTLENKLQSAIVDGDERRLRELMRNLLENALRHAQKTIEFVTHQNGRMAEIIVANDGEPVAPENRERVFERNYSTGSDGSGLGLALVAWIARAHQGEAYVRDHSPSGAEFVVRLPSIAQ